MIEQEKLLHMMARHEDQELSCPVFAFSGITMSRIKPTMFGVEMSAWIMNQVSLFIEWVSGSGFRNSKKKTRVYYSKSFFLWEKTGDRHHVDGQVSSKTFDGSLLEP